MGYTTEVTSYQCILCQDMVVTEKFPNGNIDGKENVSVYLCKTQTGLIKPTPICIRCRDLLSQIIHEEIALNKKKKQ